MEQKRLLNLRKKINKKRPSFRRVESWRYKRVKDSWRKARGIDSQTRKKTKSGVKSPSSGYRGPKKVRGLHPSGLKEVRVFQINDLKQLNNNEHAIKVSSKLGAKKRIMIVDFAQRRGFKVLNLGISRRDIDSLESMLESSIEGLEGDEFEVEDLEEEIDEE